jgi:hypothetical protein
LQILPLQLQCQGMQQEIDELHGASSNAISIGQEVCVCVCVCVCVLGCFLVRVA